MTLIPTASGINNVNIVVRAINGCGTTTSAVFTFTEFETPAQPNVSGPPSICINTTATFTGTPNYGYFRNMWSVNVPYTISPIWSGWTSPTNQSILGTALLQPTTVLGTAIISLYSDNVARTACASAVRTVSSLIISGTSTAPTISGSNQLCLNQLSTYSVASLPGVWHNWSISGNALITVNGNNLSVLPTATGVINIVARNINGCGTVTGVVFSGTINGTQNLSSISGSNITCNSKSNTYMVNSISGATYTWNVTGAASLVSSNGRYANITGNTDGTATITVSITGGLCTGVTNQSRVISVSSNICCGDFYSNTTLPSTIGNGTVVSTINAGGSTIVFNGSYQVNGNVTLSNGNFLLPFGSSLNVGPTYNISLDNAVLSITGGQIVNLCPSPFWGVYITSNSGIVMTSDVVTGTPSLVKGGIYSIYTDPRSLIRVENSVIQGNDHSFIIKSTYPTTMGGGNYIRNNVLGCDNILIPCISVTSSTLLRFENADTQYMTVSGNLFNKGEFGVRFYGASRINLINNTFDIWRYTINSYNPGIPSSYLVGNTIKLDYNANSASGISLRAIDCFGDFHIERNYIYNPGTVPTDGYSPYGIDLTCPGGTPFYNVFIEHNTISGMYKGMLNRGCNFGLIQVKQNYFVNNFIAIDGTDLYCKAQITCNTFKNTTYGFVTSTTGTVPGFANQGNTTVPAANVFINVPFQLYAATSLTGSWNYYRASDENSGFGQGIGNASINVFPLTITTYQVCGTTTPGLRLEAPENPFEYNNEFSVFPNPFNNELNVRFELGKDESYTLFIFDVIGNLVYTNSGQSKNEGMNEVSVTNINSLGVYTVKLINQGSTQVKKVIKQ
ncbi:MAG: T9SS type A sorting domain-containing protein [Bacteroidota bacterium]|nr:T9SS type A sorting domain-containing protein [Bacteroidota bacterium]